MGSYGWLIGGIVSMIAVVVGVNLVATIASPTSELVVEQPEVIVAPETPTTKSTDTGQGASPDADSEASSNWLASVLAGVGIGGALLGAFKFLSKELSRSNSKKVGSKRARMTIFGIKIR